MRGRVRLDDSPESERCESSLCCRMGTDSKEIISSSERAHCRCGGDALRQWRTRPLGHSRRMLRSKARKPRELGTIPLHFRTKSRRARRLRHGGQVLRASKHGDYVGQETVPKESKVNISGPFGSSARGLMSSPPQLALCFRSLGRSHSQRLSWQCRTSSVCAKGKEFVIDQVWDTLQLSVPAALNVFENTQHLTFRKRLRGRCVALVTGFSYVSRVSKLRSFISCLAVWFDPTLPRLLWGPLEWPSDNTCLLHPLGWPSLTCVRPDSSGHNQTTYSKSWFWTLVSTSCP